MTAKFLVLFLNTFHIIWSLEDSLSSVQNMFQNNSIVSLEEFSFPSLKEQHPLLSVFKALSVRAIKTNYLLNTDLETAINDSNSAINNSNALEDTFLSEEFWRSGDTDTESKDWSFLACIVVNLGYTTKICTGSIITDKHILTGASCFIDLKLPTDWATADMVSVRVGSLNCFKDGILVTPCRVYVNKEFIWTHIVGLAVIRIKGELPMCANVSIIPMTTPSEKSKADSPGGLNLKYAGWHHKDGITTIDDTTKLEFQSLDACEGESKYFNRENQQCAKFQNRSFIGDAGAAYFSRSPLTLYGIANEGVGECAADDHCHSMVMDRIDKLRGFIDAALAITGQYADLECNCTKPVQKSDLTVEEQVKLIEAEEHKKHPCPKSFTTDLQMNVNLLYMCFICLIFHYLIVYLLPTKQY